MKPKTNWQKLRIMRSLVDALEERVRATAEKAAGGRDPNRTDVLGLAQGYHAAFGKCDRETFERFFNMSLAELCKEASIDIGTFRPRKKLPVGK